MLEVVEHSFFKDEPSLVLRLVLASLLGQPSFPLGVEERLCEVSVPIRNLKLLLSNILEEILHKADDVTQIKRLRYSTQS